MAQGVVADNWSLQDITRLLINGLEHDFASEIIINNGVHSYKNVSSAVIQTEALFDFLTDILLRDEILVEERYKYVWEEEDSPLNKALEFGVIKPYEFKQGNKDFIGPRERIVEHLCSTDSLKIAHERNVVGWAENQETPDGLLSQTLWGGAGMCARSFVYEKSYTPHPLRRRFFINSGFMLPAGDALHQFTTFINDQKVNVSKKIFGNDSLYSAYVNIPAIPLRIIQDVSTPDQLISTALEMRSDFQKLREWLKMFQNAIASDDMKEILAYRKELDSVKDYVDKKIGLGAAKQPVTMEVGIGIFKLAFNMDTINFTKNQYGVRASMNKLIFGTGGKAEIKKYLKMFNELSTSVGYEVEQFFTNN